MPKKPKHKAYTIKGKKGFNPLFPERPKGVARKFFLLRTTIESWMIAHPGKQLPKTKLAKEFRTDDETIRKIAKEIEKHHGLPPRPRGGPRLKLPAAASKIIERCYMEAKPGSGIQLWDIIKAIAQETGKVVSYNPIVKHFKELEKEHSRGIRLKWKGIRKHLSIDKMIEWLAEEGIKAERATPPYMRL